VKQSTQAVADFTASVIFILRVCGGERRIVTHFVPSVLSVPVVGQTIYVPTHLYIGHGEDDFIGGQAIVSRVTAGISSGRMVHFVAVVERPGKAFNWEQYLAERQDSLRAQFGERRAYRDPDYTNHEKERTSW
jgi:hypothetical protein